MQQQREGQQHREGDPGDVGEGAEVGGDPLDARGDDVGDERGDEQPGGADHDVDPADRPDPQRSGLVPLGGRSETSPVRHPPNLSERWVPAGRRVAAASVGGVTYCGGMTQQVVGGRAMAGATVVDGVDVVGSLSPSRAGDFMTCPLLYRFRTIDKLPETSSPEAVRGTVVHKVLEDLFDLPAAERTPERAAEMLRAGVGVGAREPTRRSPSCSAPTVRRSVRGWCRAGRASSATSPSRTRGGSSPPSGRCTSRRCSTAGCCSGGSSTGSTSPRPARSEWWTTRPDGPWPDVRGQGAVPDEVLRAGALAAARRGADDAAADLPRQRRGPALPARRGRPARRRAQGQRAVEGDPARGGDR